MTDSKGNVLAVLDVGGTSIKVGAVAGSDVVTAPSVPTRASESARAVVAQLQRALDDSIRCARRWSASPVSGVAIAFPGPFDHDDGRPLLRGLGKFDSIHGVDLRASLRAPDVPLVFVRDSEAVGVGEAGFGAGATVRRVLTVALGTGFGSCLTDGAVPVPIVDGQPIEALHELQTPQGRVDAVLSARGLATTLGLTAAELGPVMEGHRLDTRQAELLDGYAHALGVFLATQQHLAADLIVIAGGLAGSFHLFCDAVASHLTTPVVAASIGSSGALLGAARLAFPPEPS